MVDGPAASPASLIVFSDDWGRHPSSCQHLVRRLLTRHEVCWVNTIGTRAPKWDIATLHRAAEKLKQWRRRKAADTRTESPARKADDRLRIYRSAPAIAKEPRVVNPRMWPWFSGKFDRRLNRSLLESQLRKSIADLPRPVVAVTTLPITADLVGRLPVDAWVYYCVDDFREWPGLDGRTLGRMEELLVPRVDDIVVVSETLRQRVAGLGRASHLLTHGCDLEFWRQERNILTVAARPPRPVLFWGVIDRRMDLAFVKALSERLPDREIHIVGPRQDPEDELGRLSNVFLKPAVPFDQLPHLAADADALIMPYRDSPVTRAMQPLKLKEYLATGKPVIVRNLPAVSEWSDALDVAETPDQFADLVEARLRTGLPLAQHTARERLVHESWSAKARQLESWIEQLFARAR